MSLASDRRFKAGLVVLILLMIVAAIWHFSRGDSNRSADLLELLRAAEMANAGPGLTVVEAAAALGDPRSAVDFVRERVRLQDYAGRLLDPEDVLNSLGANALDQAVLLQALIAAQGFETRILASDWPAGPVPRNGNGNGRAAMEPLYAHFGLDQSAALVAQAAEDEVALRALQVEVAEALDALDARTDLAGPTTQARPGQRAWVEYRDGGVWHGADPVFAPDAPRQTGQALEVGAVQSLELRIDMIAATGERDRIAVLQGKAGLEAQIRFLPATGVRAYLDGPPDPGAVPAWVPVLSQGDQAVMGDAFTAGGRWTPGLSDARPTAPAPEIRRASIRGVDVSAYPEVAIDVEVDAPRETRWTSAHLRVEEDGVIRLPRVEAIPVAPAPLVIVTDVSPSMAKNGVFFTAGRVGQAVIGNSARDRLVAAITAAGTAVQTRRLTWISRSPATQAEYTSGLTVRAGDGLAGGARQALLLSPTADVLILTDGRFETGTDLADFEATLADVQGRVHIAAPAGAAPHLQPLADRFWTLPDDEADAEQLGRAIAVSDSALRITYESVQAERASERALAVAFPDSALSLQGTYRQPELVRYGAARVELSLALDGVPLGAPRTLIRLGAPETAWSLTRMHTVFLSGGRFDGAALTRRYMADRRYEQELALGSPEGAPRMPVGASYDAMGIAAHLVAGAEAGAGRDLVMQGPLAIMLSGLADHDEEADLLRVASLLDVIDDGGLSRVGGARAALGLASAEGAAIGGVSVNALMAGDDLIVIDPLSPIPEALPDAARRLISDTSRTLVARSDGAAGWVIDPDGHVSARLFTPSAKGAHAQRTARQFKTIRTMVTALGIVASGAGSPYGVNGAVLGGVLGLVDADLRLLCFSSVMLGYVADSIERGSMEPDDWEGEASRLCEIDVDNALRDYMASIAAGWTAGKIGDDVTAWVKNKGGLTHWTEIAVNSGTGGFVEITGLTNPIKTAIRDGIGPPDPTAIR